jgi:hypothetical protein
MSTASCSSNWVVAAGITPCQGQGSTCMSISE